MTTTQGIKLDDTTRERLKQLGKLKQRSSHWLMRTAIEQFLEKEEEYEREKREDMERWQRYQLTGHAVSQQDANRWLSELADGKSPPCPK
jgi:predicted transcriptional regulator